MTIRKIRHIGIRKNRDVTRGYKIAQRHIGMSLILRMVMVCILLLHPCDAVSYFLHTPKSGGSSVLMQMNRDANQLEKRGVCDHGVRRGDVSDWWQRCVVEKVSGNFELDFGDFVHSPLFPKHDPRIKAFKRCPGTMHKECVVYSSEAGRYGDHFGVPNATDIHAYAMVRYPRDHVLSMYFHCTEARVVRDQGKSQEYDRPTNKRMPSTFEAWVQDYVTYQNTTDATTKQTLGRKLDSYHCYHPINLQSQRLNARSKEDLVAKFDVVGITTEMEVSTCLMSTRIYGAVPDRCKCRDDSPYFSQGPAPHVSHGVIHHGSTTKTTPEQDRLIAALTAVDLDLYNAAIDLLEEKILEIEHQFNFQLCRKNKNKTQATVLTLNTNRAIPHTQAAYS